MIDDVDAVPTWPVVAIELRADGAVVVDGEVLAVGPGDDARTLALGHAARMADMLGRPVRVEAREPDGTLFPLIVDGAGEIAEAAPPVPPATQRRGLLRRRRGVEPDPFAREFAPIHLAPEPPEVPMPRPEASRPRAAAPPQSYPQSSPQSPPQPTPAQAREIAVIRATAEAGDPSEALVRLATMEREAEGDTAHALREVRAYLTLLRGEPAAAARLYMRTAVDRPRPGGVPEDWAMGLVESAHYCWLRVDDVETAYTLGAELVAAYEDLGAGDSPGLADARARQILNRQSTQED